MWLLAKHGRPLSLSLLTCKMGVRSLLCHKMKEVRNGGRVWGGAQHRGGTQEMPEFVFVGETGALETH